MLEHVADEIFTEAGVDKDQWPDLYDECVRGLNVCMARLSARYGMSKERVTIFNQQKASLVEDLLIMKASGQFAKPIAGEW